jgi:hypothetical protein
VPIPYPNFAQASDTTGGSKNVKIGGKEINLKGKSKYKKSKGDEAATRSFGAGLISHSITGSVKHKASSFDVKVEGSNVVRNLDLTTGNHSNPGDGCTNVDTAGVAPGMGKDPDCKALENGNEQRRNETNQSEEKTVISHAKIERPGQPTTTVWSCSSALGAAFRNGGEGYVSGLERVQPKKGGVSDTRDRRYRKGKEASNLCAKARRQLRKNNEGKGVYNATRSDETPHTSHTESRILESLFAGGPPPTGTKVTFAINWNRQHEDGDWDTSDNPCERCRKLICAAEKCGITIEICDENNEPQNVRDKTDKACPGDQ